MEKEKTGASEVEKTARLASPDQSEPSAAATDTSTAAIVTTTSTAADAAAASTPSLEKVLDHEAIESLLGILKSRFDKNTHLHNGIQWESVMAKLNSRSDKMEKLWSLNEMEVAGHEPDVVGTDEETGEYLFFTCSKEVPEKHRNIAYNPEGEAYWQNEPQNERERLWWKEVVDSGEKCKGNAINIAQLMGIKVITEKQYRYLQTLAEFDVETESWWETPEEVIKKGTALSGRRWKGSWPQLPQLENDNTDPGYDPVFYYSGNRGLRGVISI